MNLKYLSTNLIVLLISISNVTAQESTDSINHFKGWKFGINVSPEFAYRKLTTDSTDQIYQDIIGFRNDFEVPSMLFTIGVSAEYRFSKILSLKSGMNYSLFGSKTKDFGIPGSYYEKFIQRDQYHYVGLPLNVKAYFKNLDRFHFFASAGGSFNFLVLRSTYITYKVSGEGEKHEFSKTKPEDDGYDYSYFNPSLEFSVGCDIKFGNHSILRLEPVYRRLMLPLLNTPIKGYFYNVGLNIGYLFQL